MVVDFRRHLDHFEGTVEPFSLELSLQTRTPLSLHCRPNPVGLIGFYCKSDASIRDVNVTFFLLLNTFFLVMADADAASVSSSGSAPITTATSPPPTALPPGESSNVKVICRVRPFASRELAIDGATKSIVMFDGDTVRVLDHERNYQEKEAFSFDHAFWSMPESQGQVSPNTFADQATVFAVTGAPAVENAMAGFHNTIFAYGQTGSGKTYTMLGSDTDEGIAPRVVRRLFAAIAEQQAARIAERVEYRVELSFLEIYNEKVKDLLAKAERQQQAAAIKQQKKDIAAEAAANLALANAAPGSPAGSFASQPSSIAASATPLSMSEYTECRVRHHPEKGTFVEGLLRLEIVDEAQCLAAIKGGMEHRAVTATLMNDTSSRSHAIFQICLTQKMPLKGTTRVSQINLVDLAGSERIKMSGVTGKALDEAKNINLSLSTLRRVIDVLIDNSKLKKGQRPSVPPFRESLLTWVLSDSLGGNSKTVMVAAISPFVGNLEDTLGTLRYALKAKAIVCHARVNEEKTAAVVHQLRSEMEELRRQLEAKADTDKAERDRLELALQQREEDFVKMQAETKRLDSLKAQYEQELVDKAAELEKAQAQIMALENVEDEKRRREEELQRARELQEQTEKMLREQEDERKRRDAELAAVLERKNALKQRHDRAAEEEARARVAAEQARLRQFATAFQNAFILGKQRSGLDELRDEADGLEKRVTTLEADVKEREENLNQLNADKLVLTRKVELLERKCHQMQADLDRVMTAKHEKISELTQQKNEVDGHLSVALAELHRKRGELQRVKDLFGKQKAELEEKIQALKAETEEVNRETEAKRQRKEFLQSTLQSSEEKLAELRRQAADLEVAAAKLKAANEQKQNDLRDLERRRALQERLRDESQASLAQKREAIAELRAELDKTVSETDALRKSHSELRQYVAHKFFPPGAPRTAGTSTACPSNGQPSTPRSVSVEKVAPDSGRRSPNRIAINLLATQRSPSHPRSPSAGGSPATGGPKVRVWLNNGYRYVDPAVASALSPDNKKSAAGAPLSRGSSPLKLALTPTASAVVRRTSATGSTGASPSGTRASPARR